MTFTLFTVLTTGSSLTLAKGLKHVNRQKCTKNISTITKLKNFFNNYEKEPVQFLEKIFKTISFKKGFAKKQVKIFYWDYLNIGVPT